MHVHLQKKMQNSHDGCKLVFGKWKDRIVGWFCRVYVGMERAGLSCETVIPLNAGRFKILKLHFQKLKMYV